MMSKLGFAIATVVFVAAFVTTDATNGEQARVNDQILSGVKAAKADYRVGETVKISFIVENRSQAGATLHFPSSQQYDVWIQKDGAEVWRWSRGRMFTQALTSIILKSGERRTFEITWNQTDNKGEQVGPGAYSIFAQLTTMRPRPNPVKGSITIGVASAVVKPTTVAAIVENLSSAKGTLVQLTGTYRGFKPDPDAATCRTGPPVTRSDWAFQDLTGCIYVTGRYVLDPVKDVGKQVTVAGRVRVTSKGQPYIQATTVDVNR